MSIKELTSPASTPSSTIRRIHLTSQCLSKNHSYKLLHSITISIFYLLYIQLSHVPPRNGPFIPFCFSIIEFNRFLGGWALSNPNSNHPLRLSIHLLSFSHRLIHRIICNFIPHLFKDTILRLLSHWLTHLVPVVSHFPLRHTSYRLHDLRICDPLVKPISRNLRHMSIPTKSLCPHDTPIHVIDTLRRHTSLSYSLETPMLTDIICIGTNK